MGRVQNLVSIYKERHGVGRGRRRVIHADLLRAAVVLLHASLEDFLRSLAFIYLPNAGEEVLNSIPLAATTPGRPEKFLLGRLAKFRGQTVDDVIRRSVVEYLERSNYNNTSDIIALLTAMEVDLEKVRPTFADLDAMMKRRHQIVHRADRLETTGRGRQIAASIPIATVEQWIASTRFFTSHTLTQITMAKIAASFSTHGYGNVFSGTA
jgi:hypothetical protein